MEDPKAVLNPRKRLRTKGYRRVILAQLEKLFCSSGLSRNGKLSKAIQNSTDGYRYLLYKFSVVEFNLLRKEFGLETSLLTNRALVKLGEDSKVFEISLDGKSIRQRTDIASSADCTIFVDNLPSEADETWLIENFENFGTVSRAEVPRPRNMTIKRNSKIKNRGFGFLEFVSIAAATNACTHFQQLQSRCNSVEKTVSKPAADQPYSSTKEPSSSSSSLTQSKTDIQSEVEKIDSKVQSGQEKADNKLVSQSVIGAPRTSSSITNRGKRKRTSSTCSSVSEDCSGIVKRSRMDSQSRTSNTSDRTMQKLPILRSEEESNPDDKRKKKIRRKKRHQKKLRSIHDTKAKAKTEEQKQKFLVLPLLEWKRLKSEYLNIQKNNMSKTKDLLKDIALSPNCKIHADKKLRGKDKIVLKSSEALDQVLQQ